MSELRDCEKHFFATTAMSVSGLSSLGERRGAVLVKEGKLLSVGYNRRIIAEEKDTEISAIYDAIFSSRDINLEGSYIFSSYFPEKEDLKLMVVTGVQKVYFLGKIDDQETTKLAGILIKKAIPLDFIQLEATF